MQPLRRASTEDLLKPHPLPATRPPRPTVEEIEQYVNSYFGDPEPSSQLRPFYMSDFASMPIDPAQPEAFSVPSELSWDPSQRCNCTDDDPHFHLTIEDANYIPIRRWRAHPAFKGPGRDEKLNALGALKVFTFGHMMILTWAANLKSNDNRVEDIVEFFLLVLQSFDFEQEIPALLAQYQPRIVLEGTRSTWPAFKDFKIGAERWVCGCPHAFRYLYNHLSGPLDWSPQWLQSDAVPEDCRNSVRNDMLARASEMFNQLRHVVYRQYGLRHIQAVRDFKEFAWQRFDNDRNRETHQNGVCINTHTIIFGNKLRLFLATMTDPRTASLAASATPNRVLPSCGDRGSRGRILASVHGSGIPADIGLSDRPEPDQPGPFTTVPNT